MEPAPAAEVVFAAPDQSPDSVWCAIEDLWLRLAALRPVLVTREGSTWTLVVPQLREVPAGDIASLQRLARDPATYTWHADGRRGCFVQQLAFDSADLVITLTPLSAVVRWPGGEDLGWQVQSTLHRLRSASRPSAAEDAT